MDENVFICEMFTMARNKRNKVSELYSETFAYKSFGLQAGGKETQEAELMYDR